MSMSVEVGRTAPCMLPESKFWLFSLLSFVSIRVGLVGSWFYRAQKICLHRNFKNRFHTDHLSLEGSGWKKNKRNIERKRKRSKVTDFTRIT